MDKLDVYLIDWIYWKFDVDDASSWTQRSLLKQWGLATRFLRRKVGDGARVRFCFDHWTFLRHLINIFEPTGVTTLYRPRHRHKKLNDTAQLLISTTLHKKSLKQYNRSISCINFGKQQVNQPIANHNHNHNNKILTNYDSSL